MTHTTRSYARTTATKPPDGGGEPPPDENNRQKEKGPPEGANQEAGAMQPENEAPMPGEFQASVTMEESTKRGTREASPAEVFVEVMSPLTPQPSELENSRVMQNLNNPQDIENPLSRVYIEGEMPSMRELDEEVPLDPRVALAAMNEFLENIQQQWRDYRYGPESFHNHGIDPGEHHANMIEHIRRVLTIENLEEQTSRASSPDTRTATKREEEGYQQGEALVPRSEVEATGAASLLVCQIDRHICPGETQTSFAICMELEEEQPSSIRWHETVLLQQGTQSEVDLRMTEDPLTVTEIVTGGIGTPHEGVKSTDVPIWDEGMGCQGTVPPKEGIIGEAHREVASPEEIQASLEGISPPMTKMTTIIMVMEVTGEAPYAQRIWEQVGQPTGQLGPEVKAMGVPKPGKYKGQDDLKEFDNWLGQLLKYFHTFKVTGPDHDTDRVLYTYAYLEGLASQWYDQEVESPNRQIRDWSFEDLISSAQNAADQFDRTRYEYEKGALAFYNDLKRRAHRMVQPPDDYSFRRKFLCGLPHMIIKSIFEARGISAEHSTIEEILEEVHRMETAQKAINMHMRSSHTGPGGKSFQGRSGSHSHGRKGDHNSPTTENFKYIKKGDTLYRRKTNPPSKGNKFIKRDGSDHQSRQKEQNRSYDRGKQPQKFLTEDKVEEVPDNPDDNEEVQAYEGTTEVAPENTESVEPDEFIDTLETYSEVDEEDEPVAYFGAMNPEDEPLEEEVVYCASIRAEVQEGQMPSEDDASMQEDDPLIREDSPGNDAPRTENGSTGSMPDTVQDTERWDWSDLYGAVHEFACDECSHRVDHVAEGLLNGNLSLVRVLANNENHAQWEYKRGRENGRHAPMETPNISAWRTRMALHLLAYRLRCMEGHRRDALREISIAREDVCHVAQPQLTLDEPLGNTMIDLQLQSVMTPNVQIYLDAVVIETPWGMVWINRDGTVEHLTSSREEDDIQNDLKSQHCPECQQCREHIDEAVAEENTSLTITLQFPAQLAFHEYNRGWEDCDRAQMEGHGMNIDRIRCAIRMMANRIRSLEAQWIQALCDIQCLCTTAPTRNDIPGELYDQLCATERCISWPNPNNNEVRIYPDDMVVETPHGDIIIEEHCICDNPHMAAMDLQPIAKPLTHAFQYAMHTKQEAGTHPQITPELRMCVTVDTVINGCKAYTMIDTGSTGNFVSPAFAKVTKMKVFPLNQQLTRQLGCIGSRSKITHGGLSMIKMGHQQTDCYFDVANINRYDCILGIPFLRQHKVVLDFTEKSMTITGEKVLMLTEPEVAREGRSRPPKATSSSNK
ncbi:hypothetical protein M404DRAFT_29338 [Pisolithus tinctorius Marx 270]|uniref:Retrotransposon gag domain-containing protein n=1 Tax=Pisolithus tinctorius Marx 270 TaxID=870435 RepID=A0A0C3IUU5_PISTI|nr:hypothetical protein M404DRAFT_29338 [Pisolithus tinctorius Marx 270]